MTNMVYCGYSVSSDNYHYLLCGTIVLLDVGLGFSKLNRAENIF